MTDLIRNGSCEGDPLLGIHHVALIASDYERSKRFYVELLGCQVLAENYRAERDSYKLDLVFPDGSQLELFSFPQPPARPSRPEACGLRHLAFRVNSVEDWKSHLERNGVSVEDMRVDEFTGHRFVFFADPDGLPLELYESLPVR
jgi:glyoxylase I family protein